MASCEVNTIRKGCYRDKIRDRTLPDLMLTGRANGMLEPDWGNWDMFIPKFLCDCAKAAERKGYKYFGIQFYAECWGGNVTSSRYQAHGAYPGRCAGEDLGDCTAKSSLCVGKGFANYVYEIKKKNPAMGKLDQHRYPMKNSG